MNILWFTWKDRKNPLAGGAEFFNEGLAKKLVENGHNLIFIVGGSNGLPDEEYRNGFKIIRVGNKFSVYIRAYFFYKRYLSHWPEIVIDEMNTLPFFTKFYVKQRSILIVHQLCREIWFYQMPYPLNLIGYFLEPIYLRLLNDMKIMTVSDSTKNDLLKFGFLERNISILPEGIEVSKISNVSKLVKFNKVTLLSFGTIRPMKRTLHIIKAFELAKKKFKDLELIVAGDVQGRYGRKVIKYINKSIYRDSIKYLGKVNFDIKMELMQKSHLIIATSVKEGWGLTISEANSQGTPAVVYNVDGLRDSVKNLYSGLICDKNNPLDLSIKILQALDEKVYDSLSRNCYEFVKPLNFKNCYDKFIFNISNE